MGKPPFRYKAAKAAAPPNRRATEIPLSGTEDVVATYSDIFLVVNEAETGMGSIYFYQRRLADNAISSFSVKETPETTSGIQTSAKCVGRVLLSQPGIQKLLEALAENRGYILTPKTEKAE